MPPSEMIPEEKNLDVKAKIDWRFEQIKYAIQKSQALEGVTWRDLVPQGFLNQPVVMNLGDNYSQTISDGSVGQIGLNEATQNNK